MEQSLEEVGSSYSDEELNRVVQAYKDSGRNKEGAARELGLSKSSYRRRLNRAAELGMLFDEKPAMPGFVVTHVSEKQDDKGNVESRYISQAKDPGELKKYEQPLGHVVGKITHHVIDGNLHQQWIRTSPDNEFDWVEVFKNAFAEYEGRAEPIHPPENVDSNFLSLFPFGDFHINLLCWYRDVEVNWNLKIAERVIGEAIDAVISRTRKADTAIILGGGDLLHNDDNSNRTAKSGNLLDADGRHAKGIEAAQRLKIRAIDRALENNSKVIVRILKGNHDEQSSVAIGHFLSAWYRNEPRVTVDLDQSLYWYYKFGKVMLAATHGHAAKLSQMPGIMAHRRSEMWGATKFRYAHGFHVHHREKIATEGNGVICESHQAPIPQDSWSFGEGYLAGRSISSITYHKDFGEFGRVIEAIIDAESEKIAA